MKYMINDLRPSSESFGVQHDLGVLLHNGYHNRKWDITCPREYLNALEPACVEMTDLCLHYVNRQYPSVVQKIMPHTQHPLGMKNKTR